MSNPPIELYLELGYHDNIGGVPCRGPAKLLLDGLKSFAQSHAELHGPNILAMHYLHAPPYGLRHIPLVIAASQPGSVLMWERASDKMRVTQIITQLFKYIIEGKAGHSQVITLEDHEVEESNEAGREQSSQDSPLTELDATEDESLPLQEQELGPMTRLAVKDPAMIAGLTQEGFGKPFPMVACSEKDLIGDLTMWMMDHPGRAPPGSVGLQRTYCGLEHPYWEELTFTGTSEHVWVERFTINDSYMGWILREHDESCMLVLNHTLNNAQWRGYHAWLGGDLGFTSLTIADAGPRLSKDMGDSGENSSRNDLDQGKQKSSSFIDLTGFDESADDLAGDPLTETLQQETDKTSAPNLHSSRPTSTNIKKEPSRSEIRQAIIRRNRIERQTEEERWRFQTPPVDTVQRKRWPPQYVSPPPTPQLKKTRGMQRKYQETATRRSKRQAQRSPSPEIISAGPTYSPPRTTHSGRVIKRRSNAVKTTSPKTPLKKGRADPKTPISPALTVTPTQPFSGEPALKAGVIVHFFLSDDRIGAIPVPLDQCDSVDSFFNQALRAWSFLGNSDGGDSLVGVRVIMHGVPWPIIVAWKAADAFGWMMDAITKVKSGKTDDLHVRVTCITN